MTLAEECTTSQCPDFFDPLASPPVYILTGVLDNADLLEDWLSHHQLLGISGVLAMDYGSTDGSVEILNSPAWSSFVHLLPFRELQQIPALLDQERRREPWCDGWGLMVDVDEFLSTSTGDLSDPELIGAMAAAEVVIVPRYEFTAARSIAGAASSDGPRLEDLTLRRGPQDMEKVMFDLSSDAIPALSGHSAHACSQAHVAEAHACILHAPVRSFDRFARKVDHAARTLSAHPDLGDDFAWHWRRWVRIRDEGGLRDEYLAQFVDDDELPGLLADGTCVRDERLAAVVRGVRPDAASRDERDLPMLPASPGRPDGP